MKRKYAVCIIQESDGKITGTHIQLYGRSEYEAIGYAIKHRIMKSDGAIKFINCIDTKNKPENDNWSLTTAEDRRE